MEEPKRTRWPWAWSTQVGREGKEEEGRSAQIFKCSRYLHGSSGRPSVCPVLSFLSHQLTSLAYSKGLQFYTELTELTKKLEANARTFVSGRVAEREALMAKIGTEKSVAPPPLAAKPPLPPPPPASAPSIDGALASMNLHGGHATSQQWQHTPPPIPPQNYGNTPISQYPPPPPRQPQQYSNNPPARYTTSPPHPHTPPALQQHQQSSPSIFMPPPPARPVQSSFSPPPATPQSDPYANLSMFASPTSFTGQNRTSLSAANGQPPLPPQQQNNFIPQQAQQPYPSPGYLSQQTLLGVAQQLPYQASQQHQLHHMNMAQQQQQAQQFGFTPPPPPLNYQYGQPQQSQSNQQQQQRNSLQGFPAYQPPPPGGYARRYS